MVCTTVEREGVLSGAAQLLLGKGDDFDPQSTHPVLKQKAPSQQDFVQFLEMQLLLIPTETSHDLLTMKCIMTGSRVA